MAKARPGRCYRKLERPWTRQSRKNPKLSYVKGAPPVRIRRFEVGDKTLNYDAIAYIISKSAIQVRDIALEAARVAIVNYLDKVIGKNYFLRLRVYPFHVLREHKQAAVAQADRYFQGMRKPFGRPCGNAAQVRRGTILFELHFFEKNFDYIKEAFRRAIHKLPGDYEIKLESN